MYFKGKRKALKGRQKKENIKFVKSGGCVYATKILRKTKQGEEALRKLEWHALFETLDYRKLQTQSLTLGLSFQLRQMHKSILNFLATSHSPLPYSHRNK